MNSRKLCTKFGEIIGIGGKPELDNCTCTVSLFRKIPTTIKGRKATFATLYPAIFSYSDLDEEGRALNIGIFGLIEEEVNPVLSSLEKNGIKVASDTNHWIYDDPRVMYVHFESIESPLSFAKKVRESIQELVIKEFFPYVPDQNVPPLVRKECKQFSDILGGTGEVINQSCLVRLYRKISTTVLGREAPPFIFVPADFAFNEIAADGTTLNIGELGLLESELNPFVRSLREKGIMIGSIEAHWIYNKPLLMYVHFLSIDEPSNFAEKVRESFRVLKIRKFNSG